MRRELEDSLMRIGDHEETIAQLRSEAGELRKFSSEKHRFEQEMADLRQELAETKLKLSQSAPAESGKKSKQRRSSLFRK